MSPDVGECMDGLMYDERAFVRIVKIVMEVTTHMHFISRHPVATGCTHGVTTADSDPVIPDVCCHFAQACPVHTQTSDGEIHRSTVLVGKNTYKIIFQSHL